MNATTTNRVIPHIIDQHAEEAAFLWLLRHKAVYAPHYTLKDLTKLDNRVEAHIDGLRIAGDYGWEISLDNLKKTKEPGEAFVTGVLALESKNIERINTLYQIIEENPDAAKGLVSALGWVESSYLKKTVSNLLSSNQAMKQYLGIAACAVHRVDPGKFLNQGIIDDTIQLKISALKAAGELGRIDLKPIILEQIHHTNPDVRFWAAWAAVLLGDRHKALQFLQNTLVNRSEFTIRALHIVCRTLELSHVRELLKILVTTNQLREAIIGVGISGDPLYIPWLIKQMATPELAKIAGESFSFITGVDIAYDDLECDAPKDFTPGPTENPNDEQVALDNDENLAFPDQNLITQWWQQHQSHFIANTRYLVGKPIDLNQCQTTLKIGKQRQRQAAAMELKLMQPTLPLFETRAVGKHQQRLQT